VNGSPEIFKLKTNHQGVKKMKKRNSARKYLFTALLVGGIIMTGAASSAYAQSDGGGTIGSGTERGGYLGSGNRDGGGGTIGSGTRTEDDGGGTIGSGTLAASDGGMLGSGTRAEDGGLLGSGGGLSLAAVWEFFF
jgi:hypothetical protein